MRKVILFLGVLIISCSSIQKKDIEVHTRAETPSYMNDTVTLDGIRITYLRDTDTTATLCALHNGDTAYTNYTLHLESVSNLPYCSFYKLRWSDESIIILTRGCNSPPNVESIVFVFDEKGIQVNYYGYIREYDYKNKYIIHSEDYSTDYLVVEEVFRQTVVDTMQFEPLLRDEDEIEISLTTEFTRKDGKYFMFSGDTVSFNFFGRDTFLLLDSKST